MPNFQASRSVPRTIVAVWTKTSGERCRQYALWSSGEVITRLASGPRRVGPWRHKINATNDPSTGLIRRIYELNTFLKAHGYRLDYHTPGDSIRMLFS